MKTSLLIKVMLFGHTNATDCKGVDVEGVETGQRGEVEKTDTRAEDAGQERGLCSSLVVLSASS